MGFPRQEYWSGLTFPPQGIFLAQEWNSCMRAAKSPQSCPTLCDPMDCRLPSSPIHEVLQARVLEWVASPSSYIDSHIFYRVSFQKCLTSLLESKPGVSLTLAIPRKCAMDTTDCVLYQRRTFPLSPIISFSSFHCPSYYTCYRTMSQQVIADPNVCEAGGIAKLGTLPEVIHSSKGAARPWSHWKVSFRSLFPSGVKMLTLRSISLTHFLVVPFLLQGLPFRETEF